MNELEQILAHLKTLQGRGWPLVVEEYQISKWALLTFPEPGYKPQMIPIWDGAMRPEAQRIWPFAQEILRGFIEREIQERGLWDFYYEHLWNRQLNTPGYRGQTVPTFQRPTLLEVLEAALEVTKGQAEV